MKKRITSLPPRPLYVHWSAGRHRSRYPLAEQIRREYDGASDLDPVGFDVMAEMPQDVRRDLQDRRGA